MDGFWLEYRGGTPHPIEPKVSDVRGLWTYGFGHKSQAKKKYISHAVIYNLQYSLWGNPGMARCGRKSNLSCWIHPAAQSTLGEQ